MIFVHNKIKADINIILILSWFLFRKGNHYYT